jgi:hypothetical protein
MQVGQWIPSAMMTVAAEVAVLVFDPNSTDTDDAVVLGPYGAVSSWNFPAIGAAANGQLLTGNGTGMVLATLTGTANRVTVANGAGSITLSGPQDLDSAAAVTHGSLNLGSATGAASGSAKLKSGGNTTITLDSGAGNIAGMLLSDNGTSLWGIEKYDASHLGIIDIANGSSVHTFFTTAAGMNTTGTLTESITDAATNTLSINAALVHRSSGTPLAGFGARHLFQLDTSTNALASSGDLVSEWVSPTNGSQKGRIYLRAIDSAGAREGLRIDADGAAARIGFFGAAAVVKQATITQTYSASATTITQTTMTDPAAYGAGANGYSTAAIAQAIHAEVIAFKANMVVTQNVLNAVIDALQAYGLMG